MEKAESRALLKPILLITLSLSLGCASAADFISGTYNGKRVLLIRDERPTADSPRRGSIKRGDAQKFEATVARDGPFAEILLDSGGGSEPDGLAIGRAIRRSGLSTRIPSGALCASACADIFMGGVARRIENGAKYGIHNSTLANNSELLELMYKEVASAYDPQRKALDHEKLKGVIQLFEKFSANAAARWSGFVLEMGGSPRIVQLGTESAGSQMNWLSREQLVDLNIVNTD
jgi:hypothetical protein